MANTSNFYNQQSGFFGNLLGQLPGWFGQLGSVIGSLFDSLINGISGLMGGGGGGLFGGGGGGILGSIMSLFGGGGGSPFGGELGIGGMSLLEGMTNIAVPFQSGAWVNKPTFAMVGENGPELVIPEKKLDATLLGMVERGGRREETENLTINAPVYINAPDPSRFQASKEQLSNKQVASIKRGLRSM